MRTRFLLIPLLLVVAFSSCELLGLTKKTGGLSIALQDGISRTLEPAISLSIAKYIVTGTGPETATFTATVTSAGTIAKSDLANGDWTVVANAYNASDVLIGTVTRTGTVTGGGVTNLTMRVVQLAGTGVLNLTVSWPVGAGIMSPTVTGVLNPETGTAIPLTLTVAANTATFTGSIPAGYYTMALRLLGSGVVKWNTDAEHVRIAANGVATTGSYALGMGDLTLDFVEDFNDGIADGWVPGSANWSVVDNIYRMTATGAVSSWRSSYFAANAFSGDFTYQGTINDLSGGTDQARGLFFNAPDGANPQNNSYVFVVALGGSPAFWVGRYVAGVLYWPGFWTLSSHVAINSVLKVTRMGSVMNFYVNDNWVYTWNDSFFSSGYSGIIVSDNGLGNMYAYDDISMRSGTPATPSVRSVGMGRGAMRPADGSEAMNSNSR